MHVRADGRGGDVVARERRQRHDARLAHDPDRDPNREVQGMRAAPQQHRLPGGVQRSEQSLDARSRVVPASEGLGCGAPGGMCIR